MAHPNDETLSFSALMVIKSKSIAFRFTLIIVTHSNINTLDVVSTYITIDLSLYILNIPLPIIFLFHGFRKGFIDPLHF